MPGSPPSSFALAALAALSLLASLSVASCSPSFHAKACKSDNECGSGLVCGQRSAQAACVAGSEDPIRIGMSAPLTGPSQELGTEMKKGISLAFDAQNAAGGVRGRRIALEFRDDQYQPQSAEVAARDLLDVLSPASSPARCPSTTSAVVAGDQPVSTGALVRGPNAVLALVGSVGTPTMVRSAPIAVETGSLFFGAFTGAAKVLRDDISGACRKYIFNVRASYAQEARATVEFFKKQRVGDSRHFISFDQNDSFGQAGYDGLVAALTATDGAPSSPITRFRYTRDDQASVPAQVQATTSYLAKLLADGGNHVVGILMTDTYGPATTYIRGVRDWQYAADAEQTTTDKAHRLTLLFSNVSFVGPNSLAARLRDAGTVATPDGRKPYTDGVFVSQVVPNYESDNSDGVRDYLKALAAAGLDPSFTSLEGYLSGRIFAAGLAAHEGAFTPDALVATFEQLPRLNLGLGATSGFSAQRHDYSKAVFGTAISAKGGFSNSYFWSEGSAIQLFE
jgi:ABC-type branched-subunit amino acid transport system substrate-binding protein